MGSRSRSGVIAARFNPLWQAIKFPLELDTFKGSFIRAASGELGEMDAGALSQQAPRRRFSRRKPDGKRVLHHSEATILERRLHFEADRCAFSSLPIFWRRHSTRARQRAAQGPLNPLTKCQTAIGQLWARRCGGSHAAGILRPIRNISRCPRPIRQNQSRMRINIQQKPHLLSNSPLNG